MIRKLFRRIAFPIIILFQFPFYCIMLGQSFEDSNNVRFEAISTAQGLSQSCVYSIVQDKKGFIWMGTRDGLNRYDGYDFLTFKNNPQDTNSISNNEITSICVNDEGNLWIGTRGGGLNYYDQSINKFTRYAYLNYENIVRAIFENEDKTLWVGTSEGLLKGKFNQAKGICSFTNVSTAGEYRNITGVVMEKLKRTLSVISIKKFSNDRLLIGAESGLFIFDKKNNQFNKVSLGESDNSIVTSSLLDADGSLWIGTFNGLVKLIPQTNGNYNSKLYNTRQKESHHLISNRIETLERDPFGNIWVGTHGGGLLKIEKTDKVTTFLNDKSDVQSIGDNTSNSLLIDNTGVLWIGTENAGCNKLDLFKKKFFHLRNLPNKINSLNDNQVTAIACGKGRSVWIGTASKGLDKLVYNPDGTYKVNHISEISDGNNGSVSEVISLYQDKEQDLWIGTASNSITQFKEGAGFKNYTTNGYVFSIHQDRSGRI